MRRACGQGGGTSLSTKMPWSPALPTWTRFIVFTPSATKELDEAHGFAVDANLRLDLRHLFGKTTGGREADQGDGNDERPGSDCFHQGLCSLIGRV